MVDKKPPFKPNWAGLSIRTQANAIIDRVKNLKAADVPKFAKQLVRESKKKITYDRAISVINKATSLIPHPAGKILVKATPAILKGGQTLLDAAKKYRRAEHKKKSRITKGKESGITSMEFPDKGKIIKKYGGPVRKAKYKD